MLELIWVVGVQQHSRAYHQAASHLRAQPGLGNLSTVTHLVVGSLRFLTDCWQKSSKPYHNGFHIGCLSIFMTWQLPPHGVSNQRETTLKTEATVFHNLISEVVTPLLLPYSLGHRNQPQYNVKGMTGGHLGGWLQQDVSLDAQFL